MAYERGISLDFLGVFDPLEIVVVAETMELARSVAMELAMSEDVMSTLDGVILHYRESREIRLADGTRIWYGSTSEPRGVWFGMSHDTSRHPRCDQIFLYRVCLEYWMLEDLLRDSDVPGMWQIQFVD